MCFSTSFSSNTPFLRLRSRTRTSHSQLFIVLVLPVAMVLGFSLLLIDPNAGASVDVSLADRDGRVVAVVMVAIGTVDVLVCFIELCGGSMDLFVRRGPDVAYAHVVAEGHPGERMVRVHHDEIVAHFD